jgi:hypothetical protein
MSTYTNHIVKVEIYDDTKDCAAIVDCFDECAAMVEIKTVTSAEDWPALSAAILDALQSMALEGDA